MSNPLEELSRWCEDSSELDIMVHLVRAGTRRIGIKIALAILELGVRSMAATRECCDCP